MPLKKLLAFAALLPSLAFTATPLLPPHLATLYRAYPHLHQPMGQYAENQGFSGPNEKLATILHELIHIDSAAKSAYVIQGQTYAPYNQADQWPAFRFAQYIEATQRQAAQDPSIRALTSTPIYRLYITNIPGNTLANLADELNAYGQTAAWLCSVTPHVTERVRTTDSLNDLVRVTDHYLATLRSSAPNEYQRLMTHQKVARNLLALTLVNATQALTQCGTPLAPGLQQVTALTQRAINEARR